MNPATLALVGLLLATPLALAYGHSGPADTPPQDVDVDVTDDDTQESVGMAWSATTIIVVIVVAVLLIALIIGLAGRGRSP